MSPSKLLPFFILLTAIGLSITHQQVTETLLLYKIQDQERLVRQLGDENQLLNYQVSALASSERLTSALAQKALALSDSPIAVVRVGAEKKGTLQLVKKRPGLLERLSLIRVAEALSR